MRDLYHDEKNLLPGYWCLRFSPDSKFLATGERDGNVRVSFPFPLSVNSARYLFTPDMDNLPKES